MFSVFIAYGALCLTAGLALGQQSDSEPYYGSYLGKLNSYHHQVGGEVYAVNEHTFYLKGFTYDGNGRDTFLWAGSRPRPGPQGFLVPNEDGRTNLLRTYLNEDITITLPDNKKINQIKWLAIYDLSRHEAFGDVYIPDGYDLPKQTRLRSLTGKSGHVNSDPVIIEDAKTITIPKFEYTGVGKEVYFWVGVGPQPHSKGNKIPDELGYLTPLGPYLQQARVTLTLPGDLTVHQLNWLSVYDVQTHEVFGFVILPEELNVPPSLVHITPHTPPFPNCEQLHRDLQVSWSTFGPSMTLELAVRKDLNEYVAFGLSGSPDRPQMVGGDAALMHRDNSLPYIYDMNITSRFPCTELLNQKRGVCRDLEMGGTEDYQIMSSEYKDGVATYTFRRPLATADPGDAVFAEKEPNMIIWAIGRMDAKNNPTMHRAWSKVAQPLTLGRSPPVQNCFSFTHDNSPKGKAWKPVMLTETRPRNFTARLGPDGGPKGYEGITGNPSVTGKAWYIDGFLAPELHIVRNRQYRIMVEGGASPHDPENYHPLIITDEPHGGFSQMSVEEQKKVRILAGVDITQRGKVRPMRGGRLCEWRHPKGVDRRRDEDLGTFAEFRNGLQLSCGEEGGPSVLSLMANKSWPATVYYNSWTGQNMGWKIHVINDPGN